MSGSNSTLSLDGFYPETDLKITEVNQHKEKINTNEINIQEL